MLNTSSSFDLAPWPEDDPASCAFSNQSEVSELSVVSSPPNQEFHLLVAGTAGQSTRPHVSDTPGMGRQTLALPSAPSRLIRRVQGNIDAEAARSSFQPALAILEPVRSKHHQLRLLIVQSAPYSLCLNGIPAPRVVVAKEKDFLQWDDQTAFHLTIYHRPSVGTTPPHLLGKECPICRVAFTADSKCFVCPGCNAGLHSEDDREGGLECVLLRAQPRCPSCGRDIVLQPGYGYQPEGHDE